MIRASMVLALARAEIRLTRRLVRYWVFQAVALLAGVLFFLYYSYLYSRFSSWSASAGFLNPRYLLTFLGIYYIIVFLLGLVFLSYDVRARDTRERMVEVLDAQPFSNLELLLGRFLGILIPCWIPVALVALIWLAMGQIMHSPVSVRALFSFSVLEAIPAYTFIIGLTFLLTLLVRHRLAAALLTIAVIIGLVVINFGYVAIYWLPAVDLTGGFSVQGPSDLVPAWVDLRGVSQRLGVMFLGLGLIWWGAAIHPRKDDVSRKVTLATGAGLVVVACALLGWLVYEGRGAIDQNRAWRAAHEARRDDPAPDVTSIAGNLSVDPGQRLDVELEIAFRAPEDTELRNALFTFNPGLEISSLTDGSGAAVPFTHENGLLDAQLPRTIPAGEASTLHLTAGGRPNERFAYIDAALDVLDLSIRDGNIFLLGFFNIIFDDDFVALLPGIRWLPTSGAEVGRGDPHGRPLDFYDLDLTVDVPGDWLVAGPGKRSEAPGAAAGMTRFRFSPGAPLRAPALVAGPLVSRSTEIDGVTLEVLVHPKHEHNVAFFEDAQTEIHDWLQQKLTDADALGLPYPYDGLTLVEVPNSLRGYGGGWRLDTVFTQPAMILARESGFPTARFDVPFRKPESYADKEGGIARAKREVLERFFENDFSGGNPFVAAARSFFSFETAGRGDVGLPMDYVTEDMTTRLVANKQGYFSVYHHSGQDLNQTIGKMIQSMVTKENSVSDALIDTVTSRSDVWDEVLSVSLDKIDPWDKPERTIDVLTLKGGAMSRSMLDGLGRARAAEFLATLRQRTRGEAYTREDIIAVGDEIGVDLEDWLDVWIEETDLPGFTLGNTTYERIEDSDEGAPRYQLLVVLRNEESTPGLVRLEYRTTKADRGSEPDKTDPLRIDGDSAVEIGIVASDPLRYARVVPYLSLNRGEFNVVLPDLDDERIVDAEPFIGSRPAEFRHDDPSIIVDDLDEGFSVVQVDSGSGLRVSGKGSDDEDTDQGLPVSGPRGLSSRWSRSSRIDAYGKYRHTMAVVKAGKGDRRAVFTAEIPRAGQWELQYYLPKKRARASRFGWGVWKLTIVDPTGEQEITLKADEAQEGWNSLGNFEIADGETRVEVPNHSDGGRSVIADAIRWVPLGRDTAGDGHP